MLRAPAVLFVLAATGCVRHPEAASAEEGDQPEIVTSVPAVAPDAAPSCKTAASTDDRRGQVCARWCRVRSESTPARWSGDATSCTSATVDADASASALRILNTHRFLAGVPEVELVAAWEPSAARCALLAHANGALTHQPPSTWRCWDDVGRRASEVSLIANRSIAIAITAFFEDPGNETTMSHRRWLLGEGLHQIAFGSTDRYSCLVVDGARLGLQPAADDGAPEASSSYSLRGCGTAQSDWVAWPPAGPVPLDVFGLERLDELGWTVQSSVFDLEAGDVTVVESGRELPLDVVPLERGKGSRSALKLVPKGWTTEANRSYRVRVHGDRFDFAYVVEPVACD